MSDGSDTSKESECEESLCDSTRELPPAARRALAEAQERRRLAEESARASQEIGGRGGLDPARYGDWEVKGLASDF